MSDLQRIEALAHDLAATHAAIDASLTKARDDLDELRRSLTPRHESVAAAPAIKAGDLGRMSVQAMINKAAADAWGNAVGTSPHHAHGAPDLAAAHAQRVAEIEESMDAHDRVMEADFNSDDDARDWDPTINPDTGERFEYEPAWPSTGEPEELLCTGGVIDSDHRCPVHQPGRHYNGMQGWIRDQDVKPAAPSTDECCYDVFCALPDGHEGQHVGKDGERWHEYRKPEPSTDDELAAGIDDAEAELEAEQRPWTSLPLITAGDGRHFDRFDDAACVRNGKVEGRRWHEIGMDDWFSDDEIAALGEVHRAEIVTLETGPRRYVGQGDHCVALLTLDRILTPDKARQFAAELLAAARAAESGAS